MEVYLKRFTFATWDGKRDVHFSDICTIQFDALYPQASKLLDVLFVACDTPSRLGVLVPPVAMAMAA
jgi:hypothetical protein